jgi:uncharacterized membrane protein
MMVFCGFAAISLSIAMGFTLLGYWLILPFAGMELALLALALYVSALRTHRREVISIDGARVSVQKGGRYPKEAAWFPRGWTRVILMRPQRYGHPSRLLIRCHGREVEVGGCLNEDERNRLAEDLRRWLSLAPLPLPAA